MSSNAGRRPDDGPLVSIIIIFLNGERFIRTAIDSVFGQTYPHWELLLADDGSTDSGTQLAKELAESHPGRVRYLEHAGHLNRGMSATRNLGVRHAAGDLIAFLDCDDVWLPHKLERQVALLGQHPSAGMVCGASEYWDGTEDQAPTAASIPDLGVPANTLFQPPDLLSLLYPLGDGTAPGPSDLLLRRRTIEKVGGFQEQFHGIHSLFEDQAFLARVYLHEPVFVSGECWTRYRLHADSCMAEVKGSGRYPQARLFFLRYLERYLADEHVQNEQVWALLRKALWEFGSSVSIEGLQEVDTRRLKWQLRTTSRNSARLLFPSEDPELIRVVIEKAATPDPWDIQLNQPSLPATAGAPCNLQFRARATRERTVNVGFSRAHEPWDGLGLYQTIHLATEWQSFRFDFIVNADDLNARVHFDLGGDDASVDLSAVELRGGPSGVLIQPDIIAHGLYPAERWTDRSGSARGRPSSAAGGARLRFSVVIPSYQRRELVLQAVRALADQDFDGGFEVIVVVDGSTDGTAEALRALQVPFALTVVEQPNQGAAAARNRGAAEASADILLFLDDDMEAHPRMLAEHERSYFEGADIVLGHLPLHPRAPANFLSAGVRLWTDERRRRLIQPDAELELHDLLTGQISLTREVFRSVGGFDTTFTRGGTFGNEDVEFGYRLMQLGCKAVFNPYAVSYQNYIIQPRHHLRQVRQTGWADVTFARKHPDRAGAIFSPHADGRAVHPAIWRGLARLRPFSAPLTAALRSLALATVEHGHQGPRPTRWFYEILEMEYWRGVHEAGGRPPSAAVRVLAYHAIRDLRGQPVLEPYGIPPEQFRSQLKLLRTCGFHFITTDEFLGFMQRSTPLPRLPILVTFDDCYADLLEAGLPILKEMNVPALAFAVSGLLGQSNTWDQAVGAPTLRLLDVEGLRSLAQNGVEIGAHSRTHPHLTDMPPEGLADEVSGSKRDLADAGGPGPRVFSYPYGCSNVTVRRTVRSAGFEAAFTVDPGLARSGRDPYLIPRIEIMKQDTGWAFLRKVINGR